MQAIVQRSLSSVYAWKIMGLLILEGLKHFLRPVMRHSTFPSISIFEVTNWCKVCSRPLLSIDNSKAFFKVKC